MPEFDILATVQGEQIEEDAKTYINGFSKTYGSLQGLRKYDAVCQFYPTIFGDG